MNLIKKFKNFITDTLELGPAIDGETPWINLDAEEMNYICSDLIDEFDFNKRTDRIVISLPDRMGETFNRIYSSMIEKDKFNDLKIPVMRKGELLFRMEFSRPAKYYNKSSKEENKGELNNFYDCVEEVIDRMESAFPVVLFDEPIVFKKSIFEEDNKTMWHRNSTYRIIRNGNDFACKKSGHDGKNPNIYKFSMLSTIPNEFILAFKLKEGYEPNKKV